MFQRISSWRNAVVSSLQQHAGEHMAKPYSEIAPDLWWDGLKPGEQKDALNAVGGKNDAAGRAAAWSHHKKTREAELARHPLLERRISD